MPKSQKGDRGNRKQNQIYGQRKVKIRSKKTSRKRRGGKKSKKEGIETTGKNINLAHDIVEALAAEEKVDILVLFEPNKKKTSNGQCM